MADEGGDARSAMWAVTTLLIVVLVLVVLYFGGILGSRNSAVNANINTLSAPTAR